MLPKLREQKLPTLRAMRADLGGGGFSRLLRLRKEIEAELADDIQEPSPSEPVGAVALVATLEALFDRQWKSLEELESRLVARIEAVPASGRGSTTKAKEGVTVGASPVERLEAVERRLTGAIDKLSALARVPTNPERLENVPPSWARQAAASATSALDGRLQSVEETVRDAAVGAKGAFDLAAEIAREIAADASLQLQVARSTLLKAVRDEIASPDRSAKLDVIVKAVEDLRSQVGSGLATAAANADRRAVAIRDVVIALTDIEMAQVEMLEAIADARKKPHHAKRPKRKAAVRLRRLTR